MTSSTLTPEALAEYRSARDAYLAAYAKADAAFLRYFAKRRNGEPTNGAAWQRLENRTNELSAELQSAQSPLYAADVDPRDIDKADGVDREVSYG